MCNIWILTQNLATNGTQGNFIENNILRVWKEFVTQYTFSTNPIGYYFV